MEIIGQTESKYSGQWDVCPLCNVELTCMGISRDGYTDMHCPKCNQVYYDMPVRFINKWFVNKVRRHLSDPVRRRQFEKMVGTENMRDFDDGKVSIQEYLVQWPKAIRSMLGVRLLY